MGRHFRACGIFLAAGIVAACGSVSGNDPSFWQPSHNLGGKQGPGAGGSGATGFGGSSSGGSGAGPATGGSGGSGGSSSGSGGSSSGSGGSSSGSGGSSSGSGGSSSGGSSSGGSSSGGPTLCQFTFDVTTHSYNGRFSPRNVEATWIEGPNNQFIKTLEVHAFFRAIHLVNWNQSAHGSRVDAISSATLSHHQAHEVKWNCTNTSEQPVPPGTYHVYFEFTEDDSATGPPPPKVGHVDFQVGKSQNLSPPDQQYFTNMHLTIK